MGVPNTKWRITNINANYAVCPTYPELLLAPASMTDDDLRVCARFRSKGRLPMLSYVHRANEATITRCSQPLAGVQQKRCPQDEQLVQSIFATCPQQVTHYIIDARPRLNAVANRASGAGYEATEHYRNCRYLCMGIDNIHTMRDSLMQLLERASAECPAAPLARWPVPSRAATGLREITHGAQHSEHP